MLLEIPLESSVLCRIVHNVDNAYKRSHSEFWQNELQLGKILAPMYLSSLLTVYFKALDNKSWAKIQYFLQGPGLKAYELWQ